MNTSGQNSTFSKAQNGYLKLGNGIIIQWGYSTGAERADRTVNWNTPFTNANSISIVAAGYINNSTNQLTAFACQSRKTTNFVLRNMTESEGKGTTQAFWIAMGF